MAAMLRCLLLLLAAMPVLAAEPGRFDYYLLSLSWSPDFCAAHGNAPECSGAKPYAFVVHGLWPQYERGYPDACPGAPFDPRQVPAELSAIMPSDPLQRHEWSRHGVCSGLSQKEYFRSIERAFAAVRIPPEYRQPQRRVEVSPRRIKEDFERTNQAFPGGSFFVQCTGRYVSEVWACFTKDLQPRACGTDIHDTCRSGSVILRPVR